MEQYQTYKISEFIHKVSFETIPLHVFEQLKKHLLDSVASMLHAVNKPTVQKLVKQIDKLGEGGVCTTPVLDKVAADRAAQLYTALIR